MRHSHCRNVLLLGNLHTQASLRCTSSQYVALVPQIKKKKNRSKRKTGFFIITAESQVEMHSVVHSDPSLLWIPGNALGTDFTVTPQDV